MASSITVRLEMEDVVVTLDEGREQHRRPEMTPGRICDGCLQKQAIAWHSFYYNGMPYFERRTSKLANVALCADCHVGSQTIDDEELVEQKISAALQPANRRRYESSTKWQAIRRRILERDEGICRFCLSAPAAAIHHFSYANYGNEYFHEVIATCHQCHHGWHVHRNAFYRKRPKAITGTRKKQFPALNRDSWRLSSHTDRSLGSKRSGPAPRSYSDLHPDPVPLHEDLWYCDCKSVICYPHGGPAKRHKVAKGCKQCGDFHKFGYFKKLPPCEPVDIGQRILDFTNARLDAFARNQFANFSWHPAVQKAIEASWPCDCKRTKNVFRTCKAGNKRFGRQCVRCGIFRDVEASDPSERRRAKAHDPTIPLAFRRNQYREHLDDLVDKRIEDLKIVKRREATKWLESRVSRMQLNLERVKRGHCIRCNASRARNVWFSVIPLSEYFSCLDLAPFCNDCYSTSVCDFVMKWNPVPLLLHGTDEVQADQQLSLF